MFVLRVIEYAAILVAILLIIWQVVIPLWTGDTLFPLLNRKGTGLAQSENKLSQAEARLAAAKLEKSAAESDLEAARLEEEAERLAREAGKKDE